MEVAICGSFAWNAGLKNSPTPRFVKGLGYLIRKTKYNEILRASFLPNLT